MPATFLNLPGELRNNIYERLVIVKGPICPPHVTNRIHSKVYPGKKPIETALLRANRQISREACSLVYARNAFDFTKARLDNRLVTDFLDQIGPRNASCIRHVHADAVVVKSLGNAAFILEFDSVVALAKIERAFVDLEAITIPRYDLTVCKIQDDAPPMLGMINACYKRTSSALLAEAPVGLDGQPNGRVGAKEALGQEFERHGWKPMAKGDISLLSQ